MIYTPFYVTPSLGPLTGTPVIDLPENIAGVLPEVHKDSLIYGTGVMKVSYDETIRELSAKNIGAETFK